MTHAALLLALSLADPAVAVSIVGTVEVNNGAAAFPLQRFDEVPEGSTVITHADGRATLRLADGTELRLGPGTHLALGKLESRSPPANRTSRVKLITGRLWAGVMGLFGNEARFDIETDNAVAGVRGTSLFVLRDTDRSSFILDHGSLDLEQASHVQQLRGPGAGFEVGGGGARLLQLDPGALADLRRDVGGPALVLADAFVNAASKRSAAARRALTRGGGGADRGLMDPEALFDSPIRGHSPADQIRGTAEITVRVRLPN